MAAWDVLQCARAYLVPHRLWTCSECRIRLLVALAVVLAILGAGLGVWLDRRAWGQDGGTIAPESLPEPASSISCTTARERDAVKLCEGQIAPFSGFLVSRDDMERLAAAKLGQAWVRPGNECNYTPSCMARDYAAFGVGCLLCGGSIGIAWGASE